MIDEVVDVAYLRLALIYVYGLAEGTGEVVGFSIFGHGLLVVVLRIVESGNRRRRRKARTCYLETSNR